jgi:hypothetical protein
MIKAKSNTMTIETYKQLYLSNGFLWTIHLEDFVRELAGQEFDYPHPQTGDSVRALFWHPKLIQVGHSYGQHQKTEEFLGEEIAPIGECSDGNIELLLTKTGRLIGFADYLMLAWDSDTSQASWKTSLERLLAGQAPTELGVIS